MKITLIGCGQIGGSLTLALKHSNPTLHITGFDTVASHAETLHRMGGIDTVATTLPDSVAHADVVILACPLSRYEGVAATIAPHVKSGAILTDVGSVKRTMEQLAPQFPHCTLIPAHPISGSEKTGPEVARADLYQGRLCVLTPREDALPEAIAIITSLWESAGATVRLMPTDIHDQLYAYVSHLPHAIAFISARQCHRLGIAVDGQDAVLARYLRISRSDARMWCDVFRENRAALLEAIGMFTATLAHMAQELAGSTQAPKAEEPLIKIAAHALPRILASALISAVSLYENKTDINARAFGAGGLRDIASPAAENPEAALAYISEHASAVAALLQQTLDILRELEAAIAGADEAVLFSLLQSMIAEAHAINRGQ